MHRSKLQRAFPLLLSSGLAIAAALPAHARERPFDPAFCGTPASLNPDRQAVAAREDPATPATVDADQAEYLRDQARYVFSGNVLIEQADQRLAADEVIFDERTSRADARGNLRYRESGLQLWGESGHLYFDTTRGALDMASFQFEHSYAHGDADRIHIEDEARTRYDNVRFTTCPGHQEDWWLRARTLRLDRDEGMGSATHARLEFYGVPIFYTPYISFPIDDRRRSGFLAPNIRQSGRSGLDLGIPYYWNIAPNYDATLTPRIIPRRGFMADTEWRLLTRQFAAETDLQYLPNDSEFGDDRWASSLRVESTRPGRLRWNIDANRVSDGDYLRDFGGGIAATSITHLPSLAAASYQAPDWSLSGQLQTWQTLDEGITAANRPYRTLPRLRAEHRPDRLGGLLDYRLTGEFTNFDHPFPEQRATGLRAHALPTVSLPWEELAYYITPSVAVSYTEYWLDRPDEESERLGRAVPIFSVDSGVFLERDLQLAGRPLQQTLEPRLFYLYVPSRDQDTLPVFDTGRVADNLGQLFRSNRFTGPDRVGDANQLSAAVTTRFIDRSSGREHFTAAVGQAFYFADREVRLPDDTGARADFEATRGRSDIMAEARANLPGGVSGFAQYHWDPYDNETRRSTYALRYRPQSDAVINLAYRTRTEPGTGQRDLEQTEISFVWPLGFRWHGIGGWRYSLLDNETIERFAGVDFYNCCWSLRLLAREYVSDIGGEPDWDIMFQLELTGLANLGRGVQDFVINAVPGFVPRR